MDLGARVAAVHHAAGVPERPSRDGRRAGDARGVGFQEVELVGGVLVHGTAEEGEEDQEDGASDEDQGGEGEERAWGDFFG